MNGVKINAMHTACCPRLTPVLVKHTHTHTVVFICTFGNSSSGKNIDLSALLNVGLRFV